MEQKFYRCPICGNIITKIQDSGVPVICCGRPMEEIVPNTQDAAQEKHVPVVTKNDNKVTVVIGSVLHPMTDAHLIEWISLQTKSGNQIKYLTSSMEPKAEFTLLDGDEVESVYSYCNLHGLWKA